MLRLHTCAIRQSSGKISSTLLSMVKLRVSRVSTTSIFEPTWHLKCKSVPLYCLALKQISFSADKLRRSRKNWSFGPFTCSLHCQMTLTFLYAWALTTRNARGVMESRFIENCVWVSCQPKNHQAERIEQWKCKNRNFFLYFYFAEKRKTCFGENNHSNAVFKVDTFVYNIAKWWQEREKRFVSNKT